VNKFQQIKTPKEICFFVCFNGRKVLKVDSPNQNIKQLIPSKNCQKKTTTTKRNNMNINMNENKITKEIKINFWNSRSLNNMIKKSYTLNNNPHIIVLNENYYKPNYKRFENYCTEKFNGRSYASISIK